MQEKKHPAFVSLILLQSFTSAMHAPLLQEACLPLLAAQACR